MHNHEEGTAVAFYNRKPQDEHLKKIFLSIGMAAMLVILWKLMVNRKISCFLYGLMMNNNIPQLTIAHLLLSGSSMLALKYSPSEETVSYGTFGNILLYGLAGFIRYAIPDMHNSAPMSRFLAITHMLTRNLALPCVVTYLYLMSGYSSDIAYVHFVSGAVPVLLFLFKRGATPLTDFILAANILSLTYISYLFGNVWGIGLAVCHIVNHFFLNQLKDNLTAPVDCLFVIGMCFFNIFAVKTLKNY